MNQSKAALPHPDVIASAVLDALIADHPAQLSFDELVEASVSSSCNGVAF